MYNNNNIFDPWHPGLGIAFPTPKPLRRSDSLPQFLSTTTSPSLSPLSPAITEPTSYTLPAFQFIPSPLQFLPPHTPYTPLTPFYRSIGALTKLEGLDLGSNEITFLPQNICHLSNLQELWLDNNDLKTLPKVGPPAPPHQLLPLMPGAPFSCH